MARPCCGASRKGHLCPDGRAATAQYPEISEEARAVAAVQPDPLTSPIPDRHVVRASHRRMADVQLLPLLGLRFVTPQVGEPLGATPAAVHEQRRRARIPNHHVAFTLARPTVAGFQGPGPRLVPPDVPVPRRRPALVAVAAMHPERAGGLIPAGRMRRAGRRALAGTGAQGPSLGLHVVGPQIPQQAAPVRDQQSPTPGVPGARVLGAGRGHQSARRVREIRKPFPVSQGAIQEARSKQQQRGMAAGRRQRAHEMQKSTARLCVKLKLKV